MDANIKALWLHDLRSGEIPQTQEVLNDGDGARCCLGVLSDIAVRNGAAQVRYDGGNGYTSVFYFTEDRATDEGGWTTFGDENDTNLPTGVAAWCGLDSDNESGPSIPARLVEDDPRIFGHHITAGVVYLATLNDQGFTFEEIADLIEEHL